MKQDKYTKSARGKHCTMQLPSICNRNAETTVLAHIDGAGMGLKKYSIHGAYMCSSCHSYLHNPPPINGEYTKEKLDLMHFEAVIRTQEIMINEGVLKL